MNFLLGIANVAQWFLPLFVLCSLIQGFRHGWNRRHNHLHCSSDKELTHHPHSATMAENSGHNCGAVHG